MAAIDLDGVTKRFGDETAVAELGERVSEFLAERTERSAEEIEDDVVRACERAADHEL